MRLLWIEGTVFYYTDKVCNAEKNKMKKSRVEQQERHKHKQRESERESEKERISLFCRDDHAATSVLTRQIRMWPKKLSTKLQPKDDER